MARNSSGTYTLPVAAFVAGTTIKSADMNTDLSDIATAITQSLATTGVSSMTGPIKCADGSLAAPSLTLASDITTGWYKSASGTWTYVGSGVSIMSLSPTGGTITNLTVTNLTVTGSFSVAANRIIGEMVDYGGASAPALWLFPFGQAVSRATYSSLFGILGTQFGAGDGVTTFNLPDIRGRMTAGRDDMGGVAANRITAGGSGINGVVLGASGGAQSTTLSIPQMPSHTHGVTDPTHAHSIGANSTNCGTTAPTTNINNPTGGGGAIAVVYASATGISIQNAGGATAITIISPVIIMNKIMYAGV